VFGQAIELGGIGDGRLAQEHGPVHRGGHDQPVEVDEALADRTGQVLVGRAPGVGWPGPK
jgi:hypothetical protein